MQKLLKTQVAVLFAGTIFAFATVFLDFARFYNYENTLFKLKDCVVPNPVVTPCFYGAFAFLLGLILAFKILKTTDITTQIKKQKHLLYLLVAGVLFAWGNFIYTVYDYIQAQKTHNPFIGCSGVPSTNPLTTPCFIGAVIFLISLIIGAALYKKLKSSN